MYDEQAYCRKCGRPIRFIRTKRGKLAPVDGFSFQIVPRGDGAVWFTEDGATVRGTAVGAAGPNTVRAWQSHFVTCPEGEAFRNRKRAEGWNETQARIAREREEKKAAEDAEKAARREERQRKEAMRRENEEAQMGFRDL